MNMKLVIVANNTYNHNGMDYVTSNVAYVRDKDNKFYKYNPIEGKKRLFKPLNIYPDYYVTGIENNDTEKFLENNTVIYVLSSKEMNENINVKYL